MGRLFWRIFLGFWLTLIVTGIAVGTAVWIHQQQREPRPEPMLAAGPRAEILLQSAAATLRFGGEAALRALLEGDSRDSPRSARVYAVDELDRELLGRPVPAQALAGARARAAVDGSGADPNAAGAMGGSGRPGRRGVRLVDSPDGRRFLLFVPAADPASAGTTTGQVPAGSAATEDPARPQASAGGRTGPRAARGGMMRRDPLPPGVGIAIGLLASLGFSALFAWYLTRPIRHLRRAFAEVADGRLETRVAPLMGRRADEIAGLGSDFDLMAERLQKLIASQRRLLHDVSHELRSPLARLQAAIGLARQSPERSAAMLERIEREAQRLDALVGEVLTLARLEAAGRETPAQSVDLGELMQQVVDDARFEARTIGRDVAFPVPRHPRTVKHAHPDWLQRAFENVIRNAVRHTGEGTTVEVTLTDRSDGAALVTVADRGPGVADAEIESIFEPFNRGSRSTAGDGHGLGLAIARRALAAHGGTIAAANRPGGGLLVTMTLPAAGAAMPDRPADGSARPPR
jgi:two-component system OmpR family sensor kinase